MIGRKDTTPNLLDKAALPPDRASDIRDDARIPGSTAAPAAPAETASFEDGEQHELHAKPAVKTIPEGEKHDQLAAKACEADDRDEDRQEALLDEGVEETFPASDPVSVKRIT